ncbi:MAG: FAD-binding oxidoreductase [Ignavibacteria bacterium]|nr:FAD-binding oxidoreductase [Ignavibacteria bacterium]
MNAPEILIIGSGVTGASIAYHLSVKGLKKILVIDSGEKPGEGSTSKATGGFRAQFGSEINIKLSLLSRDKLLNFEKEHGLSSGYDPKGYLFIASSEDEFENLKKANSLQHLCGLTEAEILDPAKIVEINPYVNQESIYGGSFCHSDGFIKPMNILRAYISSAEKLGVKFMWNKKVTEIIRGNGKITEVRTSDGEVIRADLFINSCGAWAGELATLAGLKLHVIPRKRQVAFVNDRNLLPEDLPMTVWIKDGFHFRIRDNYPLLLLPEDSADDSSTEVEEKWLMKVESIASERIMTDKKMIADREKSWSGLYEMSPDEHAVLGLIDGTDNFYVASGSSGHGVMHSPAIGLLMSEIITGSKTTIEISSLNPSRFKNKKLIESVKFF